MDEERLFVEYLGFKVKTEERPNGQYPEYVYMPVVQVRVPDHIRDYMDDHEFDVPEDLEGVLRFCWNSLESLNK